jgi:hypothetical protein
MEGYGFIQSLSSQFIASFLETLYTTAAIIADAGAYNMCNNIIIYYTYWQQVELSLIAGNYSRERETRPTIDII